MLKHINKLNLFIKKYWGILIGFFLAIGGIILFRKRKEEPLPIAQVRDSGKKFSDDVTNIREGEKADLDAEKDRHNQTMSQITKKYDEIKKDLSEEEKEECERILSQKGKDPKALADEFSKITGARVILPEE